MCCTRGCGYKCPKDGGKNEYHRPVHIYDIRIRFCPFLPSFYFVVSPYSRALHRFPRYDFKFCERNRCLAVIFVFWTFVSGKKPNIARS